MNRPQTTAHTMRIGTSIVTILLFACFGVALGYALATRRDATGPQTNGKDANTSSANVTGGQAAQGRVLYWYDPMVPDQHFDKPGKSPFMDMQLVAKYADTSDSGSSAPTLKIDPRVTQNLGVRLARVERGSLASSVQAVGIVQWNERQVAVVQARSAGYVERVYARAPGDIVPQGAPLADLLVPQWAGEQNEFLALKATGDAALTSAARERLRLAGMPPDLIALVESTGKVHPVITVSAPIAGVIQTLDVRVGMSLAEGMPLARINGTDPVWIEAAVPEAQSGGIAVGDEATVTLTAYPGTMFKGRVSTVLPETSEPSRTLRVRIELPNREGHLKAGMSAQVTLSTDDGSPVLLVPSEAVVRTGTRSLVLLALPDGRYAPVEIELGRETGGRIAVLAGLTEGQNVVASGQFLIDSEASLQGIPTMGKSESAP